MIDDLHKFERDRHGRDRSSAYERYGDREDGSPIRHRRVRPWIAVVILAVLVAVFVLIMVTDDGEPEDFRPIGAPAGAVVDD